MSKEARALLKKINDKKNAIRSLQGEGKTKEMRDAMAELRDMQEQFEMLMEIDDDDADGIKNAVGSGKAKGIDEGDGIVEPKKKYAKKDNWKFSSVAELCPTVCDPMDCSTPGFPVHHQLPELTQTHVH